MPQEKSIYVRVSEKDKKKIDRSAKRCGLSVSEFIRQRSLGYEPREATPDFLLGWYGRLCDFCNSLNGENEEKLLALIDELHNKIFSKKGDDSLSQQQDSGPSKDG